MLNKINSILKSVRKNCVCVKVPNIRVTFPFKVKAQWSETLSCVLKHCLQSVCLQTILLSLEVSLTVSEHPPQPDTALPWGTWFPTLGTEPSWFLQYCTFHWKQTHTHTHTQLSYNKNIKYDFLKSLRAQHILQNFPQIFSVFSKLLSCFTKVEDHSHIWPAFPSMVRKALEFPPVTVQNLSLRRVEDKLFTPMESYTPSINLFLELDLDARVIIRWQ